MSNADRFVPDGHMRLRSIHEPDVRSEVEQQYSEELASASRIARRRIRKQINREIERRLDDLAPPDAQY